MYDPQTKKLTHISTCFGTHHLMFAEDANRTLWTSGGGPVVGWLNTKMFDETGDEEKSQGWTALIVDTNGNGKRDAYVEPNQPVDPTKDKRINGAVLRGGAGAGRFDVGIDARVPGRHHAAGAGLESAGDRADGNLRAAVSTNRRRTAQGSRRAAWTSIAMASHGSRSPADTWRASTAASARRRSTARRRRDSTAAKDGRFMRSRCRR